MKFTESLKKNNDFRNIYQNGTSKGNLYLVMYVKNNGTSFNRLGISVSKKVGNSVVRHRIIRLIRESYRVSEDLFECGFDLIVVAKTTAKSKSYAQIKSALLHLAKLHEIKVLE